jgi:hypothetical protein
VVPLVVVVLHKGRNLIGLQMSNIFIECLTFLFKILKDNEDFFSIDVNMISKQKENNKNRLDWSLFKLLRG